MNSRQRRGVILLLVSVLCALAAFAGVLALIRNVQSKVGPEKTAYELKEDVPAYKALSGDEFRKVAMPDRWLPRTAVTDLDGVRGKTAATALHKGALLQSGMVAARPELKPGQQEIAIMIDAETGVAGKIDPGSRVNIFATFEGDQQAGGKGKTPDQSKVIVSGAKVIDVGKLTPFKRGGAQDGQSMRSPDTGGQNGGTARNGDGVPITFALSTLDAQRVAYAESFAEHVRLALVAPGDGSKVSGNDRTYTLTGDK